MIQKVVGFPEQNTKWENTAKIPQTVDHDKARERRLKVVDSVNFSISLNLVLSHIRLPNIVMLSPINDLQEKFHLYAAKYGYMVYQPWLDYTQEKRFTNRP